MTEKVSLYLAARNIPKMDKFSLSDPFVVVYTKETQGSEEWTEFHRTDTLRNQEDPQWPNPLVMDYVFEEYQPLKFVMYDRDSTSDKLKKQQLIGSFETTVGTIMAAKRPKIEGKMLNKKGKPLKKGVFVVTAERVKSSRKVLSFRFAADDLDKKNLMGMGSSDPFYRICLSMKSGVPPVVVFESEHLKKTSNPAWHPQEISLQKICNSDLDRHLRIEVHDWEKNGKHKLIGLFGATTQELLDKQAFNLINLKSKAKKDSCGTFLIDEIKLLDKAPFIEYIESGCQIKLSVCIDFSVKNGSLHDLSGTTLNQYQEAMLSVGQILQDYDSDQNIGAFGFGGLVDESLDGDFFPLSLDSAISELHKVEGILDAYKTNCENIKAGETCNLATAISKISADIAPVTQDEQSYNVILVLTSGLLDDFDETVHAIVEASDKPLSIIIVGLGDSDLAQMEHLDGDNSVHLVNKEGKVATRDIVQFVPYKDAIAKGKSQLSKETLGELPEQFERYMWANEIIPQIS